ncbi:MAG: hypothetical protein CM1200mP1_07800 [Candidatus Neomarinimicrobiota bacterium]|nr:MAG: hypothetical protein CM1200mP1_07800 [Candidatus Neomarinimicrobiota bacterium]
MNNYDLAILGGGPGGYSAAFRAAELGKKREPSLMIIIWEEFVLTGDVFQQNLC